MLLSIKTLSGKKISLEFEESDTIATVKKKLEEREGVPVEQVRLIYSGKVLNDDTTVGDAKIKPGTQIMMMMHLRGGF